MLDDERRACARFDRLAHLVAHFYARFCRLFSHKRAVIVVADRTKEDASLRLPDNPLKL